MGAKPQKTRSDITDKSQPTKAKERNEEYLKYRSYLKSKQFKEVKHIVEERDGHRCVVCRRTRQNGVSLTCHHTEYRHLYAGGETEAADCVTLCTICHSAIHSAKKNYEWFSRNNPRNQNNQNNDE